MFSLSIFSCHHFILWSLLSLHTKWSFWKITLCRNYLVIVFIIYVHLLKLRIVVPVPSLKWSSIFPLKLFVLQYLTAKWLYKIILAIRNMFSNLPNFLFCQSSEPEMDSSDSFKLKPKTSPVFGRFRKAKPIKKVMVIPVWWWFPCQLVNNCPTPSLSSTCTYLNLLYLASINFTFFIWMILKSMSCIISIKLFSWYNYFNF